MGLRLLCCDHPAGQSLIYGKREQKGFFFLAGVGLWVFPYFVSSMLLALLIAAALAAAPLLIRD